MILSVRRIIELSQDNGGFFEVTFKTRTLLRQFGIGTDPEKFSAYVISGKLDSVELWLRTSRPLERTNRESFKDIVLHNDTRYVYDRYEQEFVYHVPIVSVEDLPELWKDLTADLEG